MTSVEHWQKLVAEYPSLRSDKNKITLEVKWLHTKIILAHAAGCEYMKEQVEGEAISGLFGSMFGGKK